MRPIAAAIAMTLSAGARAAGPEIGAGRLPDEVRLIFIGDSGYGPEGGASEWGSRVQAAVARQMNKLRVQDPDRVFFLGDNVYWKGDSALYASRFDDVYRQFVCDRKWVGCSPKSEQCDDEVHLTCVGGIVRSALGNHDLKGCRVRLPPGCREAIEKPSPALAPPSRCSVFASDHTAYEQREGGESLTCHADDALGHLPFGFPTSPVGEHHWVRPSERTQRETSGRRGRQRYYSEIFKAQSGEGVAEVIVLDSNTLNVKGSALAPGTPLEDREQMAFLRTRLEAAATDDDGRWTIAAMHHPAYTPQGCSITWFGACIGGHGEDVELQRQLRRELGIESGRRLVAPDIVMAAHNHFYSRTHPLDHYGAVAEKVGDSQKTGAVDGLAISHPATAGPSGTIHFVTGGGGAPLYNLKPTHHRYAIAEPRHHFVYARLLRDEAYFWAIDRGGRPIESFCITKKDRRPRMIDAPYWAALGAGTCPETSERRTSDSIGEAAR